MIISCENCNKKFEISNNLIPDKGRFLKCGSCAHQWHYMPHHKNELLIDIKKKYDSNKTKKSPTKNESKKIVENDFLKNKTETKKNKKSIGFLSYLLILIISFIALIIIIDTFKTFILLFIPDIDFYLSSLYESLKDIFLFFKDLIQ